VKNNAVLFEGPQNVSHPPTSLMHLRPLLWSASTFMGRFFALSAPKWYRAFLSMYTYLAPLLYPFIMFGNGRQEKVWFCSVCQTISKHNTVFLL